MRRLHPLLAGAAGVLLLTALACGRARGPTRGGRGDDDRDEVPGRAPPSSAPRGSQPDTPHGPADPSNPGRDPTDPPPDGSGGAGRGDGRKDAPAETVLFRKAIDAKRHPTAVCNDGTTPVFYVRRGSEARKWVVWFKGGEACADEASCKARSGSLTSARSWLQIPTLGDEGNSASADGKAGGILSRRAEVNPDFHTWNHVYLVYCSSDGWAGDKSANESGFGFHFRGHDIATAMIDALMNEAIVGYPALDDATNVLFTGSSAGALGMRNNVDRLASMLPKGIDVRAFSDAALTPSVTPVRGTNEAQGWITRKAFWNARGDESCLAAKSADRQWECLEGRILAVEGHISTPTFWHQDQRDPKVMGDFDRNDPVQMQRSRDASAEIARILSDLPAAFSPARGNHILLNEEKFGTIRVNGLCAAEVFGNWYFGRSGPKVVVESNEGPVDRPGQRPPRGPGGRPSRP